MKRQAQGHTLTSALSRTPTHTPRHTHARTHTLSRMPHTHTYSQACTRIHILTLIYKCTLTRGQSKKIITLQRGIDCLLPCQPAEHGGNQGEHRASSRVQAPLCSAGFSLHAPGRGACGSLRESGLPGPREGRAAPAWLQPWGPPHSHDLPMRSAASCLWLPIDTGRAAGPETWEPRALVGGRGSVNSFQTILREGPEKSRAARLMERLGVEPAL